MFYYLSLQFWRQLIFNLKNMVSTTFWHFLLGHHPLRIPSGHHLPFLQEPKHLWAIHSWCKRTWGLWCGNVPLGYHSPTPLVIGWMKKVDEGNGEDQKMTLWHGEFKDQCYHSHVDGFFLCRRGTEPGRMGLLNEGKSLFDHLPCTIYETNDWRVRILLSEDRLIRP